MELLLNETDDKIINIMKKEIDKIKIQFKKSSNFWKRWYSNGNIDFIFSCFNIKARNYIIKEIDKQQLKMIVR